MSKLTALYQQPLTSTRTGALYNAFSYPTKISPEAIAVYIAAHTQPGDSVLDAFSGSGTTGLAALLCDRPTPAMKQMAAGLGLKPVWGPRVAHLVEVGTLGAFVSETLCHPPEPTAFAEAVEQLCTRFEEAYGWLYRTTDPWGNPGTLRHAIWSDVLICPHCKTEVSLWQATVKTQPLAMENDFRCPACHKKQAADACERATEVVPDAFGKKVRQKKRVLARIHGTTGTRKWQRTPTEDDQKLINRVRKMKLPSSAPLADLEWGELHRAGYHLGIEQLHHFYTKRNFIAMSALMELVEEFSPPIQDALRLLLLSYNASHSTLMTRVVLKKGQSDFVLTGAQSGVLYIPGLPVEKNIAEGIRRKAKTFVDAFRLVDGSRSTVVIHNQSSERIPLPASSINYVFTDPPFGDYIPYAELNQINELWLGRSTDRQREVIISASQAKGVTEYADMMTAVFKEMARVMKPDAMATVVFHSAHAQVWRALVQAYSDAGFSVDATSVLDKIQASFKQVVSTVSVKGDPLLLLSKREVSRRAAPCTRQIARDIIKEVRNISRSDIQLLYSSFVGRCLELGSAVDMDAKEFYELAQAKAGRVMALA